MFFVHSPVCIFNYVFRQTFCWIFTNKVSGHFQKSSCPRAANSLEVAAIRLETRIKGANVRLLWGVHPISEAFIFIVSPPNPVRGVQ
jgi:hypothetical protein